MKAAVIRNAILPRSFTLQMPVPSASFYLVCGRFPWQPSADNLLHSLLFHCGDSCIIVFHGFNFLLIPVPYLDLHFLIRFYYL